ncbi:MAG: hypothetical protein J6X66_11055 [Lachnospiraceae bacterium]|nr:hypothetical protein [Lachnospiraceae bacterium]
MNAKKHRFPVILLVFTLILAILVSGLGWPGYMLPLLSPKTEKTAHDNDEETDTVILPQGKSKAFSVNPVKGVTISAEENALDRDREFKMEELSEDEYAALSEESINVEEDMMILSAWELDAGLDDNEMLPGTFQMEFDLNEMGIDEEIYDQLRLYRIDDEGRWYEYAGDIHDGVLTANSRQNSVLAIVWAGAVIAAKIYSVPKSVDLGVRYFSGGYFTESGKAKIDVYVDDGWRFRILINIEKVKKLLFDSSQEGQAVMLASQEAAYREVMRSSINDSELPDDIKKEFHDIVDGFKSFSVTTPGNTIRMFRKKHPEHKIIITKLMMRYCNRFRKVYEQKLEATKEYQKYLEELKTLKNGDPDDNSLIFEYMPGVEELTMALGDSWYFLKEQGMLKMPDYVTEVDVADTPNSDSAGATITPIIGNPYMVIYMADHTTNREAKEYDDLKLTIAHELFHAVQRLYVIKARANYGFDEMSAQALEADAFDCMYDKGMITTKTGHLNNMNKLHYFAIPLDSYSTTYPEGSVGKGDNDTKADVSYGRAPFLRFLMGGNIDEANYTYHEIMSAYEATSGHSYMTTILKACFAMNDDRLTLNYHRFALDYQDKFYEYTLGYGDKGFAPEADLKNGKADVKLVNKCYTIRVRRVKLPKKKDSDKEFAVVLKYNDDYKTIMSDFEITPIGGLEEDTDYRNWDNGIFVDPRAYPEDEKTPGLFLMEVDGGTSSSEGYIYNDYSGYKLYALTAPEPKIEKKDGQMIIQPMKLDDYKKDVIDSVVVTGMLGDKQVMRERIEYKGWDKPQILDLNKLLKLDGESLSEEEKAKVKYKIQECVAGTYDHDRPCLGPAYEDDSESLDLIGTWALECESDYSSDLLDPIMQQYQDIIGQYGDMYGMDSIEGLYDLPDQYKQSQSGFKNTATMIVKRADKDNEYDVVFKYDNDPDTLSEYRGSFDEEKMELSLKQKDTKYTDKDGKTYNLSEFGLLGEMKFTVTVNKDSTGKNELTVEGEGSVTSGIANVSSKMSGKKISDKTE